MRFLEVPTFVSAFPLIVGCLWAALAASPVAAEEAAGAGAVPIEETLGASPLLLERIRERAVRALGEGAADADLGELERAVAAAESLYRQLDGPPAAIDELGTLRRRVSRARAGAPPVERVGSGSVTAGPRTASASPAPSVDPIALQGADVCEDAPLLGFGTFLGSTVGATRDSVASCAP
ncbi:MAG: hypothetical protein AAGF23_17075, partial [Acidobacteriota bacterium]